MNLNEKLNNINNTMQAINREIQICNSILELKEKYIKDDSSEVNKLVDNILQKIDIYKKEQEEVLDINYNNSALYNNEMTKITSLIKIKESIKLKIEYLKNFLNILKKNPKPNIRLMLEIKLSEIEKQYIDINKILLDFNGRINING